MKISLATGKVVEIQDAGGLHYSGSEGTLSRDIKYHHVAGDVQLYYDEDKAYSGVLSISDQELGSVYGVEQEGVMHFYDSSLRPLDLYAYPVDDGTIEVGSLGATHSTETLTSFQSRLSFINVSGDVSASGTAIKVGDMTFYDLISDHGTSVQGTSLDIGSIGFDNFSSSDGVTTSGSRIQIGDFSFGNWTSSEGSTLSGSSSRIGSMTFHNYQDSDGTMVTGTTMEIGDFSFTDISGW